MEVKFSKKQDKETSALTVSFELIPVSNEDLKFLNWDNTPHYIKNALVHAISKALHGFVSGPVLFSEPPVNP